MELLTRGGKRIAEQSQAVIVDSNGAAAAGAGGAVREGGGSGAAPKGAGTQAGATHDKAWDEDGAMTSNDVDATIAFAHLLGGTASPVSVDYSDKAASLSTEEVQRLRFWRGA